MAAPDQSLSPVRSEAMVSGKPGLCDFPRESSYASLPTPDVVRKGSAQGLPPSRRVPIWLTTGIRLAKRSLSWQERPDRCGRAPLQSQTARLYSRASRDSA